MSYKLYDFTQDPKLDEQIRLICDVLFNKREEYPNQLTSISGGGNNFFRQIAGSTWGDRWYIPQHTAHGSTAIALNTLYAVPFIMGKNTTISGLAFVHGTAVSQKFRIGIYSNTSDSYFYPSTLLVDSGEITSAAVEAKTFSTTLVCPANTIRWAVMLSDSNATVDTASDFPSSIGIGLIHVTFGRSTAQLATTNYSSNFVSVAQTYGALPATFPAGGALAAGATPFPIVYLRFSA